MSSSVGKRQRERQKIEKAQFKAERKAARLAEEAASDDESPPPEPGDESTLIAELAELHRAVESGELSVDDFEEQRGLVQERLERLL